MTLTIIDLLVCSSFLKNLREVSRPISAPFKFLNQNFFHENQFGFRKNYSTSHAATLLVENITIAFEKKKVIGAFLDLSKALDITDDNILLRKLQHDGVRGLHLHWFSSYLSNRFLQVLCNDHLYDKLLLNCGVPQGSI